MLRLSLLLASLILGPPAPAHAAAAPGHDVLVSANRSTPLNYPEGISWEVVVEEWEGSEHKSTQHVKLSTKGDNTLAEFIAPAKVSGRRLLMRDKGLWFFKPGLFKPVPISPRQRLLSAASYGDLTSINYARDYTVVAQREDVHEGEPCWVLDLEAKTTGETYPRLRHWVSKARLVGVRTEYFTARGVLVKWATFDFANTVHQGARPLAFLSRAVIHDPKAEESVAVLKFGRVRLETLPDSAFDLNLLAR